MYIDQVEFQTALESRIHKDLDHIQSINKTDMENMADLPYRGFHIKIVNNKLHIITEKPAYELRNLRLLDLFKYLVENFKLPDTEFIIHADDYPPNTDLPILVQSKLHNQTSGILYPDFSFYRWDWPKFPEASVDKWEDFRRDIKNYHTSFSNKKPRCLFRGNKTNPIREIFYTNTKENKLFDIDIGVNAKQRSAYIPLKNHAEYKYLLNLPGRSSSGRFKYLFMMRSVVFNIQGEYTEFWYHVLKNNYHYFEFENSIDSIALVENKIKELENNPDYYIDIIHNMQEIEKYFSMSSVINYWLKLISIYSSKLNFKVQ